MFCEKGKISRYLKKSLKTQALSLQSTHRCVFTGGLNKKCYLYSKLNKSQPNNRITSYVIRVDIEH